MLATPSSLPSPPPLARVLGGSKRFWRGSAPTAASKGHYHADRRVSAPRESHAGQIPGGEEFLDTKKCIPKLSVLKARVQGEDWFF